MQISPSDMVLFATVVREGSFTRAAEHLGITKQSVSERIARLEAELEVRLLERTTRQLRVTGAGSLYYERCSEIAAQIDEANRELQQREAQPIGLLRVFSPPLFGRRYLGPVIADFLSRHEQVQVELVLADRPAHAVEDGIDVAIHIGPLDDSTLVTRKIGDAVAFLVASPGFLKRHGAPKPAQLREARCIGTRPIEYWNVEDTKVRVEPVLSVNDLELACTAAIAGVGIARLPAIVCGEALRSGKLKALFGPKSVSTRPIYALYPNRGHLPAKVREFVDHLAAAVGPLLAEESRGKTSARRK